MKIERIMLALSSHFRLKRMRRLIEAFPITDDTSILDVGGDPAFGPISLLQQASPFSISASLLSILTVFVWS